MKIFIYINIFVIIFNNIYIYVLCIMNKIITIICFNLFLNIHTYKK